mgnify:CR=1 FL=1
MIKARIAEDDPSDRRQGPRYAVEVEGKVRELGSEGSEARVLNISEKGFMAESATEFVPLEEVERRYVLRVMQSVDGNRSVAARILRVDRKTLGRKLERWQRGDS